MHSLFKVNYLPAFTRNQPFIILNKFNFNELSLFSWLKALHFKHYYFIVAMTENAYIFSGNTLILVNIDGEEKASVAIFSWYPQNVS